MPLSITLPAGFTQRELFFAAVRVQMEEYQRTDTHKKPYDPRIFESPAVEKHEDGRVTLSSSPHSIKLVDVFNQLIDATPSEPEWEAISAKSIFPLDAENKFTATFDSLELKHIANFLSHVVIQYLHDAIELNISGQKVLSDVLHIFQLFFTAGGKFSNDPETRVIYAFCSPIWTRFSNIDFIKKFEGDTAKDYCDAVQRQLSLLLTQPLTSEKPYGSLIKIDTLSEHILTTAEMLFNKEKPLAQSVSGIVQSMTAMLFGNKKLPVQSVKNFVSRINGKNKPYIIPDECFEVDESVSNKKLLRDFFRQNKVFIDQVDGDYCTVELYRATLYRLWDEFVQDGRRPEWMTIERATQLREEIATQCPLPRFEVFENLSSRVKNCNRKNSESLEDLLLSVTKETLVSLVAQAKRQYPIDGMAGYETISALASDYMQVAVYNLLDKYSKEKTLNAQFISAVIERVYSVLNSIKQILPDNKFYHYIDSYIDNVFSANKSIKYEQLGFNDIRSGFVSSAFNGLVMRSDSMDNVSRIKIMKDLFALKGAVADSLLSTTLHEILSQYEKAFLQALDNYHENEKVPMPVYGMGDVEGFEPFLKISDDSKNTFANAEDRAQYRAILRDQQFGQESFNTYFMRWVNFSRISGYAIKESDLFFNALPTQEEIQTCFDNIQNNPSFRESQKSAFIEALKESCVNAGVQGEYIWSEIKKSYPEIKLDETKNLLVLLSEYEKKAHDVFSDDDDEISKVIDKICPKENLKLLENMLRESSPTTVTTRFFGRGPTKEAQDVLSVIDSRQPTAKILLNLRDKAAQNEGDVYNIVNKFLASNASVVVISSPKL